MSRTASGLTATSSGSTIWRGAGPVFQQRPPTDEQVGWFLEDADAVVDDFDPAPERWRVRKLPDGFCEFASRIRINDVTYVIRDGDKEKVPPVRLSTLREWQREAER